MKTSLLFFAILIGITGLSQDSMSFRYKIYDTRTHTFISTEKIINDCADVNVLFFGEEHNDSAGHYLENKIFRELYSRYGNKLALSMEMFETDNQLVLNEYLNGFIDETRLGRDARLWSNYKDYRPMVEFAKQNHLNVIAANPPRRYVSMVTRRGMNSLDSLGEESKAFLPPLPYDTLSGRYREKFMDIMKGTPGSTLNNIYYSQSLWDAGMSYSIYRYHKSNKDKKIFHCVGKFHCEEKLGTAAQLLKRNKKLKILVISSFPDKVFSNNDPSSSEWQALNNLGDYVIITDPDLKRTF